MRELVMQRRYIGQGFPGNGGDKYEGKEACSSVPYSGSCNTFHISGVQNWQVGGARDN